MTDEDAQGLDEDGDGNEASCQPATVPLTEPSEGVPAVVTDQRALVEAADSLAAGIGPVAIDTERASGYRYSPRAYLIQLRREGAGTILVDPVTLGGEVGPLASALAGTEWVLHAASQDLPCLGELGLRPERLFDTELAGRLAGYQRVALGTMTELLLGYTLEKGHSAADWSRRPLPHDWLVYAALDVELLVELRDALERTLTGSGKLDWARQEFEAVRTAPEPAPRAERWRRTSGIHRARSPRALAGVRALWQAREEVAARRDIAPGRILPDRAVVDAAVSAPTSEAELAKLPVFRGRAQRRMSGTWMAALRDAAGLAKADLPATSPQHDGPPPPARWADRDPAAAKRLATARASLATIAESHEIPVENLLTPDLVRRICWEPPEDRSSSDVAERLREGRARPWQIDLVTEALTAAVKEGEE